MIEILKVEKAFFGLISRVYIAENVRLSYEKGILFEGKIYLERFNGNKWIKTAFCFISTFGKFDDMVEFLYRSEEKSAGNENLKKYFTLNK